MGGAVILLFSACFSLLYLYFCCMRSDCGHLFANSLFVLFCFFHNFKQFFISNYRTSGYLLSTAQVHVAMLRAVKAASVVEPPPLTLPQSHSEFSNNFGIVRSRSESNVAQPHK